MASVRTAPATKALKCELTNKYRTYLGPNPERFIALYGETANLKLE